MEMAVLDAVRQAPADRLSDVLNHIRSLSVDDAADLGADSNLVGDIEFSDGGSVGKVADPDVYAGVVPGGMSFEIPPNQIRPFLYLLVDTLEMRQVTISYEEDDGNFAEYTYRPEEIEARLISIEAHLVDPSLLVEFEGGVLYTGGEGCFSLRSSLTSTQIQSLIGGVFELLGFDLYPYKEITGMALFDGERVTYR